jgi:colanic acid biosynthesis glycosyl transferase WcaI
MRILVHDFSGHPFQAELSRELSRRGHVVTHSWCAAHVSGRGRLEAEPGERLVFAPIAVGERIDKLSFASRLVKEFRYGRQLARQTGRLRPDVVLLANVPIPMLVTWVLWAAVRRVPFVLWQQDVQGVAVRSFAGTRLTRAFLMVAIAIGAGERWASRRARAIVVISDSFRAVHREWGTDGKVSVIPNWAPVEEITPTARDNAWAVRHGLDAEPTLLYSGTLGLKHNPALLVQLARSVRDRGTPVRLVVVSEGPAMDVIRHEAHRLDVPVKLLPFQPYADLPGVLGSGDVLVVLLEATAGGFSVPSKTLSYLCAGRPVLGLLPPTNLAASLIELAGSLALPPEPESLPAAATWLVGLLADEERRTQLGAASRTVAEKEFALGGCADNFEKILEASCR